MRLLIIEDDALTAKQLLHTLRAEKFTCDWASGYNQAKGLIYEYNYNLILLDWNLGDGDGLVFLKESREDGFSMPVLMLSANSEIEGRVEVLDSGADDYLCKPYSNIELLARLRALLRRNATQKGTVITIREVTLNIADHKVEVSAQEITLTKTEFDILELLMKNANVVLTRYQLNEHICKESLALKHSNLIDAHIKNIRKKLGSKEFIQSVRGVGYTVKR